MSLKLVVCVSGRGGNLGAICQKIEAGELNAEVVRVISSRAGSPQVELSADIELITLDRDEALREGEGWRLRYDVALLESIRAASPDLVVLAGFDHILGQHVLAELSGRVINLHPAMPGAHDGRNALRRAHAAGEGGGVMVHWVTAGVDSGPVLVSEPLAPIEGEVLDAFADRVHALEHRLLPEVIGSLATDSAAIDARRAAFQPPTRRALLSVSDKSQLAELGRGLVELGFSLVASGGTARALREAAVPVDDVETLTDTPEMLGGRVKTLHPAVHGGLLARADQLAELAAHGYVPIDLVAVNLYPFAEVIRRTDELAEQIEAVDIGGVALLRAAAKNFERVTVLSAPSDYAEVLSKLADGDLNRDERKRLAAKAFQHTAAYDSLIAAELGRPDGDTAQATVANPTNPTSDAGAPLPKQLNVQLSQQASLRYGENPHQAAAYYGGAGFRALTGKALSYNNILDADAAWEMACGFEEPTVAVVKHTNPCGLASAGSLIAALSPAFECDEMSAFGSVVAFNREVNEVVVKSLGGRFVELLVAPSFSSAAIEAVQAKSKKLRAVVAPASRGLSVRSVAGGVLVQQPDAEATEAERFEVVCGECDAALESSLRFASKVVRYVKSNAIVLTQGTATVGVGAGQMSRVDAAELAIRKAGERARGSVLGSDAFFPFPDAIELAAKAGVIAIVQPGGSIRDGEVIEAAKRLGLTMVLTGRRSFRH